MDLKEMHPKYPLDSNQEQQAKSSYDYIKSLHVEEFMNELLTHLIYTQPENPKAYLVDLLKKAKKDDKGHLRVGPEHLEKPDYEAMFDAYDVLNLKAIPYGYLVQALQGVGVTNAQDILKEKYPDIKESAMIGKKLFVSVLSAEHRNNGYAIA